MSGVTLLLAGVVWLVGVLWLWHRRRGRQPDVRYDWDVLSGGILFLLTIGFFWRTVSGDVFQPADGGDLASFLFPTYRFAAAQLAQGVLPLWNPTLYGGAPFIADIQAGFLYLPNLILFVTSPSFPYTAMQWLSIGHLFWAGLGMYALLRVLRWPDAPVMRVAALFGAVAFQYSDPLLIHIGNLNLIAALSWLPWVFAAYVLSIERGRLAWAGVAGVLFAVGIYAGHAQSTLYVAIAITVYTLLRALLDEHIDQPQSWQAWVGYYARRYLAPLAVLAVVAALLAGPLLLPALQLTGYTERSDFSYQETVAFSLAPAQAATGLLTPGFFGRGPALHWGLWQRVELPYAGVATLIMAAAALLLSSVRGRRQLWPWVGLGLFGMAAALGIYGIVHGWLTALLPMFDQFRAPARALVLWTFTLAVLGAVGVDLVARRGLSVSDASGQAGALRWGLRAGALILVGVVLPMSYLALLLTQDNETAFLRTSVATLALTFSAAIWLAAWAVIAGRQAGWWSPNIFGVLMVGLVFFDLSATGAYTDISEQDPTAGFRHDEIADYLHGRPGLFRIDSLTGIESVWQPDTAALYGLQDVGGIANPLSLRHWHQLLEATGGREGHLYDMLNAAYVIVQDGTPLPEGKYELAFDAPGDLSVFRNVEVMPRAWVVHEATAVADMEAALAAVQSPDFDPARSAVIVADSAPPLGQAGGSDLVDVSDYAGSRIQMRVQTGADGLLVLSEIWYPGWRATVNGVGAPVLAANGGLRAVAVPAGESEVELWFHPQPWRYGLALAVVGLVSLVVWMVFGLISMRRQKTQASPR